MTLRPSVRRIAPELRISLATARCELVMPSPGPVAKILLAEFGQQLGREPQRARRLDRASRRAGIARRIPRQKPAQRLELRAIAEIGWRVGGVDRSFDAVDGGMSYQPEEGLAFHADLPGEVGACGNIAQQTH